MKGDDACLVTAVRAICCGLAVQLLVPVSATAQHPTPATQQAQPAPRAEKPGAVTPAPEVLAPVSLEDLAKRISAVVAGQAGGAASAGADAGAGGGGTANAAAPARARSAASRPSAGARKASLVTLKWDASLASGGVSLSWDRDLDPKRAGRADLGVRLVWPDRRP